MERKYQIKTIFWALLGLLTLLPAVASSDNLIGYYSLCSFAPISSLVLFGVAGVVYWYGQNNSILTV